MNINANMNGFISRGDAKNVIEVLVKNLPAATSAWDELSFHLSRHTKVTIKFEGGPVGLDEFDALLAHIAFYKTFFKDEEKPNPLVTLAEIKARLFAEIDKFSTA